jgi:hypothetical protein
MDLELVNVVGSHDGIYNVRNMLLRKVFSIVLTNFDLILKERESELAAKTLRSVFSKVSKIASRRRKDVVFSGLSA